MSTEAFHPGSIVLLTLTEPRQKFFGLLLELDSKGVVMRGVPLESLEDLARLVHAGEQADPSTLFFPMHRVERMELDTAEGVLPSLADNFSAQSGRTVFDIFGLVP